MKTKLVTVIAVAFFIMPKVTEADKPTSPANTTTAKSQQVELIVENNPDDSDFSIILSNVENEELKQEVVIIKNSESTPGFDILEFIYEEPEVDDLEIDTKAIFREIMNEKKVK